MAAPRACFRPRAGLTTFGVRLGNERVRGRLVDGALRRSSLTVYLRKMRKVARWMRLRRVRRLTKRVAFVLVSDLRRAGIRDLRGYRAAIRHELRRHGAPLWCDDADFVAACTNPQESATMTGSLTESMFRALLDFVGDCARLRAAILLLFLARLRIGQLLLFATGDLQKDGETAVVFVRHDKRRANRLHTKTLVGRAEWIQELLLLHEGQQCIGQRWWDAGIERELKTTLRSAAVHLKWPSEVEWGRTHVFRVSGAGVLRHVVTAATVGELAQQSPQVFRHYARSLQSRVASMRRRRAGK